MFSDSQIRQRKIRGNFTKCNERERYFIINQGSRGKILILKKIFKKSW